jgi:hypothetical protein
MSMIGLQTISDISFDPGFHAPYRCHLLTTWKGGEMRKNLAIAAALLLAGCVSMGTNYDVAAVDRLQVGMTKAQVIDLLGQPNQVVTNADGSERFVWVHSTGSLLGAIARSVGLPFGPDGRLTDIPQRSPQ